MEQGQQQQPQQSVQFASERDRQMIQTFFQKLPSRYEDFLQNKNEAFHLLARQKNLIDSGKITQEDATQYQRITESRGKLCLASIFSSALGIYYFTKGLRYNNIAFGMTYRFSLIGFLMKFYFMPQLIARSFDTFVFEPSEKSLQAPILAKYNLNDQEFADTYYELKRTNGLTSTVEGGNLITPTLQNQQQQQSQQFNTNNNINTNQNNYGNINTSSNQSNNDLSNLNFDLKTIDQSQQNNTSTIQDFSDNYGQKSNSNSEYYKAFRN